MSDGDVRRIEGIADGVDYHQFYLNADVSDAFPEYPPEDPGDKEIGHHRLIAPSGHMVCVEAGIAMGTVHLAIEFLERKPTELDTSAGWEAVSEISFEAASSDVSITYLMDATHAPFDHFILPDGPGWYRVRGHAIGRSLGFDGVAREDDPRERHLLQLWRTAGPQRTRHHRIDDQWANQ